MMHNAILCYVVRYIIVWYDITPQHFIQYYTTEGS